MHFKQDGVLETVCLQQQGAGSASYAWIERDFAGNARNTSGKVNSRNWYQEGGPFVEEQRWKEDNFCCISFALVLFFQAFVLYFLKEYKF